MDFDMPSPSQFPSSSQWARASTRPAPADMSVDMDVGVVSWIASQPAHPALQKLIAECQEEEERGRRPRSSASTYTSTWASSTSTSVTAPCVTTRAASLPTFAAPSSSSLPSASGTPASTSTSSRRFPPRSKPMSKKVPPSRAYSATAPTKNDVPPDPEQTAQLLHMLRDVSAKVDENSRLKQMAKAKAEKKAGTSGDITTRTNTVSASSSGSNSTSRSTARHLTKAASTSTITSASSSAPPQRAAISRQLSSATIKPTVKLSRDSGTHADIEMTSDSDRDTDLEGSTFTDSLGNFAPNESFSMHVDEIIPPPKRMIGKTPSTGPVSSTNRPTASSSNSGFASSSKALTTASSSAFASSLEKIPQSTHVRPPVTPSTSQRHPPPLGMRRVHNLPNTGFASSQARYATTQAHYASSQAKAQKQTTLPPFKPPLLAKHNPKPVPVPKRVVEPPDSPPTSTPELDKDDSNDDGDEDKGGTAGADSSFDVSFDVDADALEATMRQY
ncbi:uncharacterized protein EDB91DRAFT_1174545, partial [Suillus paluster]|uniref:uncharacterized protein n=1 Tax=Suillus paluster TaxID=48578 RepID=UPI001B87E6E5